MQNNSSSTWIKQMLSFAFAFRGIKNFLLRERNARWHFFASLLVIATAVFLRVSSTEAVQLVLVIGLVWIAEMLNSCIEKLVDFISLEHLPILGYIKDMAAGAVLIASICALVTGLIIFIPKL